MKGLKDNWIGFLGILVIITILFAFMAKAVSEKADKDYVDGQIQNVLKEVSYPLKSISNKLDSIRRDIQNGTKGF